MLFCTKINDLQRVLENEMIQNTDREVAKFIREGLSLEEISRQQEEETGPYYEEVEDAIEKFSNKTENIEVMSAITLAQIYDFNPKEEILICFEMKDKFDGRAVTLSDFTKNFKTDTHVDCAIRLRDKEWRYQITRYNSKHQNFTDEGIISYIKNVLVGYGNMSDTALILLLQPLEDAAISSLNFEKIHKALLAIAKSITFKEISLAFNANMKTLSLVRVFPKLEHGGVPLQMRSPKYQKIQEIWEDEMRKKKEQENT